MTTTLTAHFDGKVLIPDETVDLPQGCKLEVVVTSKAEPPTGGGESLLDLVERLKQMPSDPDWPEDGAAQLDHYLYGTPKRP